MAHGVLGLMPPLRSRLNASKIRLLLLCGGTEQHRSPATRSERGFSSVQGSQDGPGESSSEDHVTVHFINRDGERLTTTAKEGQSLLEVVVNHNLAIDGFGACEGTLACSTCHLIFDKDTFQKLGAISDEELDMLDLAYGLTDTSRLGCQVCVKKSMDGVTVRVPMDVSDMRKQLEVGKQSKQ
ncbi:PREDICTED: adrenodoxin-like [Ficedula albicollis]|uniref:2Fe-2S ferredoxin-type domain-containing protein n=1 Tax=Ficedula albicollis TaxID=59894 RepID=A0A803W2V2_FICAL|nr:PREDICTED: adrenodoxin-like [Ficedula albicollis]XP_016153840.1 PREDICTED: adrenodoxin-like [Ficedula albicollis]XP_016153841.1 PREDICTED: adrenodoxin-like [Ficedula albicollis]